jgi:hypothetical protein
MKWVSVRPGDDRPGVPPEVAILEGATEYLDIAVLSSRDLKILVDDNRQALFHRETTGRVGKWRVQFAVGGANCKIERHTMQFVVDGANYFSEATVSTPPPESRHVGLFSLLRGQSPDDDSETDGSDEPVCGAPE